MVTISKALQPGTLGSGVLNGGIHEIALLDDNYDTFLTPKTSLEHEADFSI